MSRGSSNFVIPELRAMIQDLKLQWAMLGIHVKFVALSYYRGIYPYKLQSNISLALGGCLLGGPVIVRKPQSAPPPVQLQIVGLPRFTIIDLLAITLHFHQLMYKEWQRGNTQIGFYNSVDPLIGIC